jgi:diphthamide synthase (EF-2-diphthine--ammonia ligase)
VRLWQVSVTISAVSGKGEGVVRVGQEFDKQLVEALRAGGKIDPFGEHGEFHTQVSFVKARHLMK